MQSIPFVIPTRPIKHVSSLWSFPQDFFYALLTNWSLPKLIVLMDVMNACITLLPNDGTCTLEFWRHHFIPICLPAPSLHPPETAFLALKAAALLHKDTDPSALETIIASMRVACMLAFVVDTRIRAFVLVHLSQTHGRLGTRPPCRHRVWRLLEQGASVRLREYVTNVESVLYPPHGLLVQGGAEWCQKQARELAHWLIVTWCTGVPPIVLT